MFSHQGIIPGEPWEKWWCLRRQHGNESIRPCLQIGERKTTETGRRPTLYYGRSRHGITKPAENYPW